MKPRWSMSTVPHSGTRYICDSILRAGYSVPEVIADAAWKGDLMWSHFDEAHKRWTETVRKNWPNLQHFVVVRNPIHTLCSHYKVPCESHHAYARLRDDIIKNLGLYYRVQDGYIKRFNPYIHRVEDPIASLGDWLAVDLGGDGERFSRPNPSRDDLREAVNARDVDRCFQIAGPVFEWFIQELSPRIAPLYRDKLGYDFWWH